MKTLECSSRGDKRFSAKYAKVSVFGVVDTIENHYQKSKRDMYGEHVKKGAPVDHFILDRMVYPASMLSAFYRLLWIKYLDKNPDLVEYAKQFDDFTDMFRGKSVNCQADVIRDYLTDREKLVASCSELKERIQMNKIVSLNREIEYQIHILNLVIDDLASAVNNAEALTRHENAKGCLNELYNLKLRHLKLSANTVAAGA